MTHLRKPRNSKRGSPGIKAAYDEWRQIRSELGRAVYSRDERLKKPLNQPHADLEAARRRNDLPAIEAAKEALRVAEVKVDRDVATWHRGMGLRREVADTVVERLHNVLEAATRAETLMGVLEHCQNRLAQDKEELAFATSTYYEAYEAAKVYDQKQAQLEGWKMFNPGKKPPKDKAPPKTRPNVLKAAKAVEDARLAVEYMEGKVGKFSGKLEGGKIKESAGELFDVRHGLRGLIQLANEALADAKMYGLGSKKMKLNLMPYEEEEILRRPWQKVAALAPGSGLKGKNRFQLIELE